MKKTLILAATALSMVSAPAFAQVVAPAPGAQQTIQIGANVAKACGVGAHKSGAAAAPGWDQSNITVNLTNGGDGKFNGETFTNRSFGNVWCNGPATVTLEAAALTTSETTTDTTSFTNRFDVRVVTDAGVYIQQGEDYILSTVGETSGKKTVAGAPTAGAFETGLQRFGGADSITILADASGRRPVAGVYKGWVRFSASVN